MSLLRKKTWWLTTQKIRNAFTSTPLERLNRNNVLEVMLIFFTGISKFLAQYSLRFHQLKNIGPGRNNLLHYRISVLIAYSLTRI